MRNKPYHRQESFAVASEQDNIRDKREDVSDYLQKGSFPKLKANTDNLWKRMDVPHEGWQCEGITDLSAPVGICEMCDQIIRYVHHMVHDAYRPLGVGCVVSAQARRYVDNHFSTEVFPNRESAIDGAFEALERLKSQK